jgi:aspartyl-tRNA(Asn)/glutamyl-tRNA(Gln) amidotransferase subunit C
MSLKPEEIQHIARLARLKLTDEELSRYGAQLTSILDYVGQLQSVAAEGVEPTNTVSGAINVTREDVVTCIPGETARKKMLAQSAMRDGHFLKVPGVFNE